MSIVWELVAMFKAREVMSETKGVSRSLYEANLGLGQSGSPAGTCTEVLRLAITGVLHAVAGVQDAAVQHAWWGYAGRSSALRSQ